MQDDYPEEYNDARIADPGFERHQGDAQRHEDQDRRSAILKYKCQVEFLRLEKECETEIQTKISY